MTDQINAKEYNLWELLSGKFIFRIPDYQRPYSWTENEALTLWDDLIDFWKDSKANKDQTYFIGSIVLVKSEDSPESEVIDGQQRITTLSLILSVLLLYSSKLPKDIQKCLWEEGIQHLNIPGKSRLTLRKRDAVFFEKYVATAKIQDLESIDPKQLEDDSQRLLLSNGLKLKQKADELFSSSPKLADEFVTALFNRCFFVVVTTPDNESAFRVFSVMNNRGLSLLPSDIIKAHIIGAIDEASRHDFTDKWEDIEVDLGREAFNSLLSHIRMVFSKTKLHGTLVSEFERIIFKKYEDKKLIITDVIEPYARAYKTINHAQYSASSGAEEVNELLSWMNRVDDSDWIPAMMCAIVNYGNDSAFIREFANGLERIASYCYLTSKTSNQRIEKYGKIISALQAKKKDDALSEMKFSGDERKDFLDILDGDVYLMPARKRTYLLLRLDRIISDKAVVYQNGIFSIEHVLPQNPKEDSKWMQDWADAANREYWTHKLANLIPLTRKKNSQAQNYDFAEKKKKYFSDSKGVTTYALATEIILEKVWTPETVAARQKRLIAILSQYWMLSSSAKNVEIPTEIKTDKKQSINKSAEILRQERLLQELDLYFAANPGTPLPRLIDENVKVGEYVHRSMHRLSESSFSISEKTIETLCTVEGSRKYTHRNLPYLVPLEKADLGSKMMMRYWVSEKYIETFNGKQYYVYSQWYPDHKSLSDAHRSDFLQLYLDLALGNI